MAMIGNSSYYIVVIENDLQAIFYDSNGNEIKKVAVDENKLIKTLIDRRYSFTVSGMEDMLDQNCISKIKPGKLVIDYCIKRGPTLFFYDKTGRVIDDEPYSGKVDKVVEFLSHQVNCKYDVEWILRERVPILDNRPQNSTCSVL